MNLNMKRSGSEGGSIWHERSKTDACLANQKVNIWSHSIFRWSNSIFMSQNNEHRTKESRCINYFLIYPEFWIEWCLTFWTGDEIYDVDSLLSLLVILCNSRQNNYALIESHSYILFVTTNFSIFNFRPYTNTKQSFNCDKGYANDWINKNSNRDIYFDDFDIRYRFLTIIWNQWVKIWIWGVYFTRIFVCSLQIWP